MAAENNFESDFSQPYSPFGVPFRENELIKYSDKEFHSDVKLGANGNRKVIALLPGVVVKVWKPPVKASATPANTLQISPAAQAASPSPNVSAEQLKTLWEVEVYHPYPGLSTSIGNLESVNVKLGQHVERGAQLGAISSDSAGYIQLVVKEGDNFIEPVKFLQMVGDYLESLDKASKVKSGEPSKLVTFVDGAENLTLDKQLESIKLVPWTSDEKKIVGHLLERAARDFPEFMTIVQRGRPIKFARSRLIISENGSATATTLNDVIVLSDRFFGHSSLFYHVILHELVHRADYFQYIAYSKEWVDFANPIVAEAKKKPANQAGLIWPDGFFLTADYTEGFADYVAKYLRGSYYPSRKQFERQFAPLVLAPTRAQKRWTELMYLGHALLWKRQFKQAAVEFKEAISVKGDRPASYLELGYCLGMLQDVEALKPILRRYYELLKQSHLDRHKYLSEKGIVTTINMFTQKSTRRDLMNYMLRCFPQDKTLLRYKAKVWQ